MTHTNEPPGFPGRFIAAIPSAIEMGKDVPEINAEFRFTVFWIFVGISQKRLEMLLGVR